MCGKNWYTLLCLEIILNNAETLVFILHLFSSMVKTLAGTDSDDEDTLAWVLKNRKIQDEREKAAKQVNDDLLYLLVWHYKCMYWIAFLFTRFIHNILPQNAGDPPGLMF